MMDKMTATMDNGDYVIGILLDISKAFDTINHDVTWEIIPLRDPRKRTRVV